MNERSQKRAYWIAYLTACCILVVGVAGAAHAQLTSLTGGDGGEESTPKSSDPQPADIEQLITKLQDSEAREQLISDLRLLLDAGNGDDQDSAKNTLASLTASDVVSKVRSELDGIASDVKNVDLGWLLQRLALSIAVVSAAIVGYFISRRTLQTISSAVRSNSTNDSENGGLPGQGLRRALQFSTLLLALLLLGQVWGTGPIEWLSALLGREAGMAAVSVVAVFVVALLCWHAVDTGIDFLIRKHALRNADGRQASRLKSIIPLIKGIARLTVAILAALLILSELGLNIGPLLAGAGILGVAVGFGAQSLVKDFLVGISILIEDSATVGDVIEAGGGIGMVEQMDLRVIRLRNLDGALYTIPYSEVSTIRNLTKEFSYHLFDLGVAYGEDIDQVIKIIEEVAAKLASDDEYSQSVLDDVQIFGLDQFGDSALIIKGRIKTAPGAQWSVGREFNRRIKIRFDELSIEIPFPHRTLYFGKIKDGETPPAKISLTEHQQLAEAE